MLEWLKRRFGADPSPMYAAIKRQPNRELPPSLAEQHASADHQTAVEASCARLRSAPHRPADDVPLLHLLGAADGAGQVSLTLPEGLCLLLFTSPFRAMDYASVRLGRHTNVPATVCSPADLAMSGPSLTAGGVTHVAVDVCPRCETVLIAGAEALTSVDAVITLWSTALGVRDAQRELYLSHAALAVGRGERREAREIALEVVAHVDPQDPRPHWLLGQIAVASHDRSEFREAMAFLQLLGQHGWCTRLEDAWARGEPVFDHPPRLH